MHAQALRSPHRTAIGLLALTLVTSLAACQATGSGPSPSTGAVGTPPAVAGGSPSVTPSQCTEPRTLGDTTYTTGTVLRKLDRGRILFRLEGAGGTAGGVFAFGFIDQAGLHTVVTDDYTMGHAIWTPDGAVIFDSERNDDRHLFRMAVDGTGVTQLTSDFRRAEVGPAFIGPDRLVFGRYACDTPADLGLYTAAADGSGAVDLTPGFPVGVPQDDAYPTVSPDGRTVVFIRFVDRDDTTGGLWSIPATGGTAARLTADAKGILYPRFSPDGKAILFSQADAAGDEALWLEPASGGTPRQLTTLPAGTSALEADWSPDGSEIVTKEYQQGWTFNELHVLHADGSGDQLLWRGKLSTAEEPDWGP